MTIDELKAEMRGQDLSAGWVLIPTDDQAHILALIEAQDMVSLQAFLRGRTYRRYLPGRGIEEVCGTEIIKV